MFDARVNDQEPIRVVKENDLFEIAGKTGQTDMERIGPDSFQLRSGGQNHKVHVVRVDLESKQVTLKVNGKRAVVTLTSDLEKLLSNLGMHGSGSLKAANVKAPMPGLIHSIMVQEGQSVVKGEPLLILEAMKMENVIKSPADGLVNKIHAQKGSNVDKGAMLISFG
jgi:biotin carboxyl carrier protein